MGIYRNTWGPYWTHRTTTWTFMLLTGLLVTALLTQTWVLVGVVAILQSLILMSLVLLPYRTR